MADYAGPLAGFMTGLERCETPYLLTVPCDTPLFPSDLAARLAEALGRANAEIAMAAAREEDGQLRTQPVFCLLRAELLESLVAFTHEGGRKIDRWTAQHKTVTVPFDAARTIRRRFLQRQHPGRTAFAGNPMKTLEQIGSPTAGLRPAGPERQTT
jgi:molybdopterin-guanine dinucleotide biosynthesis protein A